MKTIVHVSADKSYYLDLQMVRKYLISQGVTVLDFFEESISEVHFITKGMRDEVIAELRKDYRVETFHE